MPFPFTPSSSPAGTPNADVELERRFSERYQQIRTNALHRESEPIDLDVARPISAAPEYLWEKFSLGRSPLLSVAELNFGQDKNGSRMSTAVDSICAIWHRHIGNSETLPWMQYAWEDLHVANTLGADTQSQRRFTAYACQQAVEKGLKAFLLEIGAVSNESELKRVGHDLSKLLSAATKAASPEEARSLLQHTADINRINPHATAYRYPLHGRSEQIPDQPTVLRTVEAAGRVLTDIACLIEVRLRNRFPDTSASPHSTTEN